MLFILILLFLPCAIVGAFVTAEDQDLTAFQTAFSFHPLSGVLHGRSDAVAKDRPASRVPAPSYSGVTRRADNAPAVVVTQMLITGSPNRLPTTSRSFCPSPSPTVLIWPAVATCTSGFFGIASKASDLDNSNSSPARRRRGPSSAQRSRTALMAMAIPARCALPSVDLLREAYGHRRSFWGDLTPAETRRFYHELLPVSVYLEALGAHGNAAVDGTERPLGGGMSGGGLATVVEAVSGWGGGDCECIFGAAETLEEQARLASMARHAARMYVRERCKLPSRVLAHLYDGLRHLKNYGSFRVTGMTWEELWEKYEKKIKAEDPTLEGEDLKTSICLRILEKSCCTSEVFNNLSGCSELNTFLPATDSVTAANSGGSASSSSSGSSASGVADGGDDEDLLEGLEIFAAASDEASSKGGSALQEAYAAEQAAACAGALRLTRLVKPFPADQEDEQPPDRTQSGGGGCSGGVGGGSRFTRLVPLPVFRAERAEALKQKRAGQRLRKTLGKRKFPKRPPPSNAA